MVDDATVVQNAYFAGVFDASGQMIIMMGSRGRPTPLIELRRATPELLEAIKQRFGGKVVWYEKGGWYYWKRTGKNAKAVVRQIRPFLIAKAKIANRMLRVSCRNRGGPLVRRRGSISEALASPLTGIQADAARKMRAAQERAG